MRRSVPHTAAATVTAISAISAASAVVATTTATQDTIVTAVGSAIYLATGSATDSVLRLSPAHRGVQ